MGRNDMDRHSPGYKALGVREGVRDTGDVIECKNLGKDRKILQENGMTAWSMFTRSALASSDAEKFYKGRLLQRDRFHG